MVPHDLHLQFGRVHSLKTYAHSLRLISKTQGTDVLFNYSVVWGLTAASAFSAPVLAVTKTKLQAKQAADTAAKRASQGALFGALALLLGALAAFFAGHAGAVTPTVSVRASGT